jgi:hypothetical protein
VIKSFFMDENRALHEKSQRNREEMDQVLSYIRRLYDKRIYDRIQQRCEDFH